MTRGDNQPRIFTPEYYERLRQQEEASWWNAGMRDVATTLLGRVPRSPAGFGLDIGCGSGQTMRWLRASLPGWRFHGFDVARDGVVAASGTEGGAVTIASALALPYPDRCADLVVMLDVLQHLPLPGGDLVALDEIRRVLRPGGHFLLRTNARSFPGTPDDYTHQFHQYRTAELRRKLATEGFRILRLSRVNAVLGLAEIPRELQARWKSGAGYHGILAEPPTGQTPAGRLKRGWLRCEGRLVALGLRLPIGRTHVALAAVP